MTSPLPDIEVRQHAIYTIDADGGVTAVTVPVVVLVWKLPPPGKLRTSPKSKIAGCEDAVDRV